MLCRFGCSKSNPAVVTVALSDGCFAYPGDGWQDLCLYHAMASSPRGTIVAIALLPGVPDWDRAILATRYQELAR